MPFFSGMGEEWLQYRSMGQVYYQCSFMRSGTKIKRLFTDFLGDMVAELELVVIKRSAYSVDPNALKL